MPNYVEHSTLVGMPLPYRAVHGLLMTGTEVLARALALARERSLDTAVIAEITASMALANAARAMVLAIHHTRSITRGPSDA